MAVSIYDLILQSSVTVSSVMPASSWRRGTHGPVLRCSEWEVWPLLAARLVLRLKLADAADHQRSSSSQTIEFAGTTHALLQLKFLHWDSEFTIAVCGPEGQPAWQTLNADLDQPHGYAPFEPF